MTEKELKQLCWLNREIESLQKELKDLEYYSSYKSPVLDGMPKGNGYKDNIADYVAEVNDLRAKITLNLRQIQREREKIENYINQITDSRVRLIYRLRFINNMSWYQISCELGYSERQVLRVYEKHRAENKDVSECQ